MLVKFTAIYRHKHFISIFICIYEFSSSDTPKITEINGQPKLITINAKKHQLTAMLEAKYCSRLKMRERERLRKSLESNETCVNPYTLPRKDEDSGTV